jgi:hypothetical protein
LTRIDAIQVFDPWVSFLEGTKIVLRELLHAQTVVFCSNLQEIIA